MEGENGEYEGSLSGVAYSQNAVQKPTSSKPKDRKLMGKKVTPPDRASRQSKAVPTTALGLEGRRSAPPDGLLCRFSVPLLLRPLFRGLVEGFLEEGYDALACIEAVPWFRGGIAVQGVRERDVVVAGIGDEVYRDSSLAESAIHLL